MPDGSKTHDEVTVELRRADGTVVTGGTKEK